MSLWPRSWPRPAIVFSTAADWQQALALAGDPAPLPAALAERIDKLKAQYPARPDLMAELQKLAAVEVQGCRLGSDADGWLPRPVDARVPKQLRDAAGKSAAAAGHAGPGRDQGRGAGRRQRQRLRRRCSRFSANRGILAQGPEDPRCGGQRGAHALYLDPWQEQQEFFPYRLQERDAWNLEKLALEKLPASDRQGNGVDVSGTVQLAVDGASGTLVVAARGIFNRYNEATADSGKFIAGLLKKIFPVEKVEIKKLLALSRREVRVEVTFNGKWLKGGRLIRGFFSVDAVRLPGLTENMVQPEKRETPLALDAPFQVELQPGAAAGRRPEARILRPECGAQERARPLFPRPGRRKKRPCCGFPRAAPSNKALIGPEKYPLLRELLLPYFAPDFWLVFKKQK